MSQNRDAPAYQEYAASMMAKLSYRTMNLQERGLLYSMRLECWVNSKLPRNSAALAKVLGFDAREVSGSLAAVMPFFNVQDDYIFSPELEDYRTHLESQRERMSSGGKKGAATTNSKLKCARKPASIDNSSTPTTTTRLPRQPPRRCVNEVLVQSSTKNSSQHQPPVSAVIIESFIADYEAAESCTAEAYAKASEGAHR